MGQKIVLSDTVFTDTTLPILYNDPILSSGSLALLDFGHSLGAFAGVPTTGSLIPNVAWSTAQPLVAGSPSQSALSFTVNGSSATAPSYPLMERTPDNGLHVIRSQANDVGGAFFDILLPASVLTYLAANTSHDLYVSIWHNVTRAAIDSAPHSVLSAIGRDSSDYAEVITPHGFNSGTLASNASNGTGLVAGPGIIQSAWGPWTGVSTSAQGLIYMWGAGIGFSALHVGFSSVLYRLYVEDLTVSGRTYADVASVELAMYTAAFAVGGKFYADTFTNPAGYP